MNIEKGKTPMEQDYISFKNTRNEKITLVAQGQHQLRCAIREDGDASMRAPFTHFTRDEVKVILPYLQAFAASGEIEPAKGGLLQGWSLLGESIKKTASLVRQNHELEAELTTMQEAGVAMAANIVDQGKRIQALQNALRIWRDMASETYGDNEGVRPDGFQRLCERTAKLLGEEEEEVE